jgi:hypothetical protein
VTLTRLDRTRLANIRRITAAKAERTEWRTLLSYFKAGPSTKVRYESARALSRVSDPDLKASLVTIASDTEEKPGVRTYSVIALRGSARHLTDEDIESILASDEGMRAVFVGALTDLAPDAELSDEQIGRILNRYDGGPANVRGNRNVGIVNFVGRYLARHRGDRFDADVRPVLERFLFKCARSAGAEPPNLRSTIGRVMAANNMPGAVEVLIESLKDEIDRTRERGQVFRREYPLRVLGRVTGKSMVTEEEKKGPDAPAPAEIARRWLEWWERNRHDPQYRLPPEEAPRGPDARRP